MVDKMDAQNLNIIRKWSLSILKTGIIRAFVVQFVEKRLILSFISHIMKKGHANDREKFSTDSRCSK